MTKFQNLTKHEAAIRWNNFLIHEIHEHDRRHLTRRTPPIVRQPTMAAPLTFEQLLDQSGIPATHQMAKYLKHIGVIHKSQFALMFKDADSLAGWCNKFKSKVTFGDQEIEVTDEDVHSAMTGALTATFIQCKDEHENQRLLNIPASPATAAITLPTTAGTPAVDDKVPKTWPPGEYQRLITQYHDNSGKTRHFSERTVLGADKVLVRMWHEHHKSKNYTAVTLGEIITNRTFTALGTVNSTVKKDKLDKTLTIDTSNNTLIQQEQKDWDPQTSMMILDALDAIQWAWILIQLGTENEVTSYIERFKTLTRRNGHRLPNIKALWDTFAWEIAVHMRTSTPFGKITADLLADPVQLADILSQPLPKKQKGEKGKGKGKNKSKFKSNWNQTQWYTPRPPWQQNRQQTQYHNNYSYGPSQRQPQNTQYNPFPPTPLPPHIPPNNNTSHPAKDRANNNTNQDPTTRARRAKERANIRDSTARRKQLLRHLTLPEHWDCCNKFSTVNPQ